MNLSKALKKIIFILLVIAAVFSSPYRSGAFALPCKELQSLAFDLVPAHLSSHTTYTKSFRQLTHRRKIKGRLLVEKRIMSGSIVWNCLYRAELYARYVDNTIFPVLPGTYFRFGQRGPPSL